MSTDGSSITDRTVPASNRLTRRIGLATSTFLVIASMVGTGIFTTSGLIMESLGDPRALVICWLVGGFFALCGALSYGELAAMFPRAGGEYVYLRESFGSLVGFLSGWISLIVGFSAPIAASAIAAANYCLRALPEGMRAALELSRAGGEGGGATAATILAVGIILLFSLIHIGSLTFGSRVQNGLTLFKIGVILLLVILGLGLGRGSTSHFAPHASLELIFSERFAGSLIFVSFAYSGWNAAAYLGGEIRNPARNIPLALFMGTLFVMVLYLLLNVVFIYALSVKQMSGVIEVGAEASLALFGPRAGKLFSGAVMVGILSVISAMIMSGPRVYYAMARDGAFFPVFGRVSRVTRTPAAAICLQGIIAAAMVLSAAFDLLLLYIGFTLSLFAMLAVAGMMVLRVRSPRAARPYRTFAYPVTPALFILGNLWIVFFFVRDNPRIALYGAATILAGIAAYFWFRRRYGGVSCSAPEGGDRGGSLL
jgi:APA family basic amino acid/polyamine antiporter